MLRLKAKEFCDDPEFKASVGWYINWKRRHSITLRTKTTLAQRLPNDLEEQTVKFHRFVIAARQRHGYLLSRIFNMDETPMRFEMPSSRTLAFLSMCIARLVCKYMRIYLSFSKSISFVQVKLSAISRNPLYKSDFNSS